MPAAAMARTMPAIMPPTGDSLDGGGVGGGGGTEGGGGEDGEGGERGGLDGKAGGGGGNGGGEGNGEGGIGWGGVGGGDACHQLVSKEPFTNPKKAATNKSNLISAQRTQRSAQRCLDFV